MWRFKSIINYFVNFKKVLANKTKGILLFLYWSEDLPILSAFELYL